MTINFPSSLDNFTNPTSSSPINSPSHADQHANANDAIEALEAKVGIDGSTVATSHDYKIAQLQSLVTSAVAGAKSIYQDVRNQSGSAFTKATPVYVSGSTGASGQMLVSAASNAAESTSSKTMGLTTSTISNNNNGQVISEGILEGIDTTGAADGDPVWLGTNGTKIYGLANKPSAPAHLVFLGIVIRGGQANTGSMYVKIQNGFELHELHNVEVSSLVNGNILAYDSTTQTWKNTNTLQSTSSTIPLVVKGVSSQTANLQEWQNSSGTAVAVINPNGVIQTSAAIYSPYIQALGGGSNAFISLNNSTVLVDGFSASTVKLTVKGYTSQTANLQEWQNSAETVLAKVDASGNIYTSTTMWAGHNRATDGSATYNFTSVAGVTYAQASITRESGFNGNLRINQQGNGAVLIQNGSAIGIGLIVKGYSSQSANLQEWQDSSGTLLASVNQSGFVRSSVGFASTTSGQTLLVPNYDTGGWAFTPQLATQKGLIIRGAASQTADLQQWQNSAGTVNARIDAYGTFQNGTASGYGAWINVQPGLASDKGIIIRGAASQTANLQEWQESTGTVLSYFSSAGNFWVTGASRSLYVTNRNNTGNYIDLSSNSVGVYGRTTTDVNLIIKAAASQTANLLEFQDSSGTVVGKYNSSYQMTVGSLQATVGDIQARYGIYGGGTGYLGALSIVSWAANVPTAVFRGYASQTANLTEWQNSSGTVLANINSAGGIKTNAVYTDQFYNGNDTGPYLYSLSSGWTITNRTTVSNIIFTIKGMASQTGDLQQWQNSSATILGGANALAQTYIGSTAPIFSQVGGAVTGASGTGTTATVTLTSAPNLAVGDLITVAGITPSGYNATNVLVTAVSNTSPFSISYANTTTAAWTSGGTVSAPAQTSITARSAGTKALVLKGATSQASTMMEIQASDGTAYLNFNVFGNISSNLAGINPGRLSIGTGNTSVVGAVIRGVASQTANLQEWQDSSGTVLAKISSNGQITSNIQASSTITNPLVLQNSASGIGTGTTLVMNYGGLDYAIIESAYLTTPGAGGAYLALKTKHSTTSSISTKLLIDNQGTVTINGFVAGAQGLIIKAAASQSANLQEWQDSSGTVIARIANTGQLLATSIVGTNFQITSSGVMYVGAASFTAQANITSGSASTVGLIIKAAASQTANLQEWQDSSGTVLSYITASGALRVNSAFGGTQVAITAGSAATIGAVIRGATSQTANLQEWQDSSGTLLARTTPSGSFLTSARLSAGNNSAAVANINSYIPDPSLVGLLIRRAASQTANLQEWQDESGVILSRITNGGGLRVEQNVANSIGGLGVAGQILTVSTAVTTNVGLVVKGVASQTANLQQWQDSSGNVLGKIAYDGKLTIGYGGGGGISIGSASFSGITYNGISNPSGVTSYPTLIIKGVSSQTANLQEWHNSSGTILLSITSDGSIKGGNSNTISVNTASTVDTVALSSFTSMEYTLSIKQGSKIRSSKVLVHTDGTLVDSTEYGIMEMGGGISGILVTASVSGTDAILQVTITDAATTNATVKLIKTML